VVWAMLDAWDFDTRDFTVEGLPVGNVGLAVLAVEGLFREIFFPTASVFLESCGAEGLPFLVSSTALPGPEPNTEELLALLFAAGGWEMEIFFPVSFPEEGFVGSLDFGNNFNLDVNFSTFLSEVLLGLALSIPLVCLKVFELRALDTSFNTLFIISLRNSDTLSL
jgi:hypothetical protein